jgi:DNA/RNA-binding domain of Phe-tRNA-synthetase-like protein
MVDDGDPVVEEGWVDHVVAAEFPELRVRWMTVPAPVTPRSPPEVQARLQSLAGRMSGQQAVGLRRQPIPHAYRVFFRAIGLDPDTTRTPVEELVLERLFDGGYVSRGHLADALRIGLIETSVPLWALDARRLDGPLGVRLARAGERLGRGDLASDLPAGRLVVADAATPVAVLFGGLAPAVRPSSSTRELRIFSVQVAGVPEVHVAEALWLCAEALDAGGGRR